MADTDLSDVEVRLECLRIAVEFGTQRDMQDPENLVERYYKVVTQGSGASRPDDSGKDHSRTKAQKSRNVR
tara:strand:+ start:397 stop:609 length:213 start_codon:yes stop_codon:yes gene_type:complete